MCKTIQLWHNLGISSSACCIILQKWTYDAARSLTATLARPFGRDGHVHETPTRSFSCCGDGMDDGGDRGSQRCT